MTFENFCKPLFYLTQSMPTNTFCEMGRFTRRNGPFRKAVFSVVTLIDIIH